MPRKIFTEELWTKLKVTMLANGIYDKPFLRQTIEGIFYRLRVGCPSWFSHKKSSTKKVEYNSSKFLTNISNELYH